MKKTSDLDTSLIRHDYKRAVYRAMLSELEYRRPETVVWVPDDRPVARDGRWFIQDLEYGRDESFSRFCGEKEIDLSGFGLEDRMIMVCNRDYFCPVRKRVVLHAGAAYGAPTCMSSVRHRKLKGARKGGMGVFIQDMAQEEIIPDSHLEGRRPTIRIEKTGRGRFSLRVTGGFQYRETAPVGEITGAVH